MTPADSDPSPADSPAVRSTVSPAEWAWDRALGVGLRELAETHPAREESGPSPRPLALAIRLGLAAAGIAAVVTAYRGRIGDDATATEATAAPAPLPWNQVVVHEPQDPVQDPAKGPVVQDPEPAPRDGADRPSATRADEPPLVSLRMRRMDLPIGLLDIAERGRLSVVVDRAVAGTIGEFELREVPADVALARLAEAHQCEIRMAGPVHVVRPRPLARPADPAQPEKKPRLRANFEDADVHKVASTLTRLGYPIEVDRDCAFSIDLKIVDQEPTAPFLAALEGHDCVVFRVGETLYVRPAGDADDSVTRVTIKHVDIHAQKVLDELAKRTRLNLVVAPEVGGTVRVNLHELPWPRALAAIAIAANLEVIHEPRGILRVLPARNDD